MASFNSVAVPEWIRKMQDVSEIDFLRELMQLVTQFLIDAEATQKIGAERGAASNNETAIVQGPGTRASRRPIYLNIPNLRYFFPFILEPRRRAE